MTSKERFDVWESTTTDPYEALGAWQEQDRYYEARIKELETELSAVKGKQEPFAWMVNRAGLVLTTSKNDAEVESRNAGGAPIHPLYLSPPNEKQIKAAALHAAADWFAGKECRQVEADLRLMAEEIEKQ